MNPKPRPMRRLPALEERRQALETCTYCPKLCRSACPVSNAEPKETLIPWGKMSMAFFAARGDVPASGSFAAPAWACTGCFGCRDACDHKNDVAGTLLAARAAIRSVGGAPAAAQEVVRTFPQHDEQATSVARARLGERSQRGAPTVVLPGCTYLRRFPDVADDVVRATAALVGPVEVHEGCCGLPLLLAGDAEGFARVAGGLRDRVAGRRVVAGDPGCVHALRIRGPEHGVAPGGPVETLVELAARDPDRLGRIPGTGDRPVRFSDPCVLARGLGVVDAPRTVLARALGRAPDEFVHAREGTGCTGGGGLLPVTWPEVARGIAEGRVAEHAEAGGGEIVAGCASGLLSLRARGAEVSDLATWIARSLDAG
jgi:Fe-S oxidoreductase